MRSGLCYNDFSVDGIFFEEETKVDIVTSGELEGFIILDPKWSKQDIKNVFSDWKKWSCKGDRYFQGKTKKLGRTSVK